jgi:hypothetical protein
MGHSAARKMTRRKGGPLQYYTEWEQRAYAIEKLNIVGRLKNKTAYRSKGLVRVSSA